jgi:type IV pilus assembly protein PilO
VVLLGRTVGSLESKQQTELKLRDEFVAKKKLAVNLDLYVQRLNEIDRSFGALLKQLPNKSEVEALLVEINQAGMGRGLQFESVQARSEQVKDFLCGTANQCAPDRLLP